MKMVSNVTEILPFMFLSHHACNQNYSGNFAKKINMKDVYIPLCKENYTK